MGVEVVDVVEEDGVGVEGLFECWVYGVVIEFGLKFFGVEVEVLIYGVGVVDELYCFEFVV